MAVRVQIYYLWCGRMSLLHVYVYMRLAVCPAQGALGIRDTRLDSVGFAGRGVPKPGLATTPPKMTSSPPFSLRQIHP
jgi:hypothetical protein